MTAIMDSDPLASTALPVTPFAFRVSHDKPSGAGVRPFGLTRTVSAPPGQEEPKAFFDPQRQLTVMPDGTPWIEASPGKRPASTCGWQTQDDHQYHRDSGEDD